MNIINRDMTRISDLEKFALTEVYRPYQTALTLNITKRLERLTPEYNLENVVYHLEQNKKWASMVLNRITRCKFTFAEYLKSHELVFLIENNKLQQLDAAI